MAYRLLRVNDAQTNALFLKTSARVYRDEPAWVPPLGFERRRHFKLMEVPSYSGVEIAKWVVVDGRDPVGRISAQILTQAVRELHPPTQFAQTDGFFGYLEAIDEPEVFAMLFEAAHAHLRSKGITRAFGPLSPTTNFETGLLVEGREQVPYFMMPYAKPYYADRLVEHGYRAAGDLLAYDYDLRGQATDRFEKLLSRLRAAQPPIETRPIDRRTFAADIQLLADIYNEAWHDNWGFVPISRDAARTMAHELSPLFWPELGHFAIIDGEPIAAIMAIPDLNAALHGNRDALRRSHALLRFFFRRGVGRARVLLLGVKNSVRDKRLRLLAATACIAAAEKGLKRHGLNEIEFSWVLESNRPMRRIIEACSGAQPSKRYRVFETRI